MQTGQGEGTSAGGLGLFPQKTTVKAADLIVTPVGQSEDTVCWTGKERGLGVPSPTNVPGY